MSKFILTIEVELELVSELVRYLKSAGVKLIDERFVRDGETPLKPGVPSSSREDVHPRGRRIDRAAFERIKSGDNAEYHPSTIRKIEKFATFDDYRRFKIEEQKKYREKFSLKNDSR